MRLFLLSLPHFLSVMSAELPVCLHTETSIHWMASMQGEIDFTTTTRQQKKRNKKKKLCFPEYSGTEWRSVLKTCSLWYVKVVVNSHCRSKVEYKLSFSQGPTHRSACQGHILFLQKMREHFFTYTYTHTHTYIHTYIHMYIYIYPVLVLMQM